MVRSLLLCSDAAFRYGRLQFMHGSLIFRPGGKYILPSNDAFNPHLIRLNCADPSCTGRLPRYTMARLFAPLCRGRLQPRFAYAAARQRGQRSSRLRAWCQSSSSNLPLHHRPSGLTRTKSACPRSRTGWRTRRLTRRCGLWWPPPASSVSARRHVPLSRPYRRYRPVLTGLSHDVLASYRPISG